MMLSDLLILQVNDVLALLFAACIIGAGLVVLSFVAVVWGLGRLVGKGLAAVVPEMPAGAPQSGGFTITAAAAVASGDQNGQLDHGYLTTAPSPDAIAGTSKPAQEGSTPSGAVTCSFCQRIRNAAKKFLRKKK